MIASAVQTIHKYDFGAALLSILAIIFPFDIITPILSLYKLSPLSVASLSVVMTLVGLIVFLRQYKAFSGMALIPAWALLISGTVAAAELAQSPEETFFIWRLVGAAAGSAVFTIMKHRRNGDLKRSGLIFAVGIAVGFVGARYILDKMGGKNIADHWMQAAFIGGFAGYMALQIVIVRFMKTKREATNE